VEFQCASVSSPDKVRVILTDKGFLADTDPMPAFDKAIAITSQGVLCELDRQGGLVDDGIPVQSITAIEWGTTKCSIIRILVGLVGLLVGVIGLVLLPSTSVIINALEATLCGLAAILVWTAIHASRNTYLLCKGERSSIAFILRVPIDSAAQEILQFIQEIFNLDPTPELGDDVWNQA